MKSHNADSFITIAEEAKLSGNCSKDVNDYGKGGFQFSQKFTGFSNY